MELAGWSSGNEDLQVATLSSLADNDRRLLQRCMHMHSSESPAGMQDLQLTASQLLEDLDLVADDQLRHSSEDVGPIGCKCPSMSARCMHLHSSESLDGTQDLQLTASQLPEDLDLNADDQLRHSPEDEGQGVANTLLQASGAVSMPSSELSCPCTGPAADSKPASGGHGPGRGRPAAPLL